MPLNTGKCFFFFLLMAYYDSLAAPSYALPLNFILLLYYVEMK